MKLTFSKYQGLGNDFIVVDLRHADAALRDVVQRPTTAIALCDRQFGVGADGVLAIVQDADEPRMRVLNADGSEAEMCGNGLRCVAHFLTTNETSVKSSAESRITINTGAGRLTNHLSGTMVKVDMGPPRFLRREIPMTGPGDEPCTAHVLPDVPGARAFTAVSMGNPHAITFVASRELAFQDARSIGPLIETHAAFPKRTNAEFAAVRSRTELDLVVWERGVGITLACGTGACATVAAACRLGHCDVGTDVTVHLPGGDLVIRVAPDYATVWMTGPATRVFDGEADLGALLAQRRPS